VPPRRRSGGGARHPRVGLEHELVARNRIIDASVASSPGIELSESK